MKKKREMVRSTEAAAILGCSSKSIQRWSDARLLRPVARGSGGHRRFTRAELERFRTVKLGDPRCPHCGRSLISASLHKRIQSRPVEAPRKGAKSDKIRK
jgi:hypothetical protein